MTRAQARIAGGFALLSLCACVSALHDPPSVGELVGSTAHGPADVEGLLAADDRAYVRWTLASVRTARPTWLEAAAADPTCSAAWIGASAQLCGEAAPSESACNYWLAVALGVQARERRTTALDALPKIVALLEQATVERPELEQAGPHRVLALVLVRAPGWPAGPGDAAAGLEHARRAVALAPEFPPNQLCLAEALAAVDEREESGKVLDRALTLVRAWQAKGEPEADEWLAEIDAATTDGWAK
jgi:hypothetical protein